MYVQIFQERVIDLHVVRVQGQKIARLRHAAAAHRHREQQERRVLCLRIPGHKVFQEPRGEIKRIRPRLLLAELIAPIEREEILVVFLPLAERHQVFRLIFIPEIFGERPQLTGFREGRGKLFRTAFRHRQRGNFKLAPVERMANEVG